MSEIVITREDGRILHRHIAHGLLRAKLARATFVPGKYVPPHVVTLGSRVAYHDETANVRGTVTLVLPGEADALAGRICVTTPFGSALLGMAAGETMTYLHADGTRHRLLVEYVLTQPERTLGLALGA